VSGKFSPDEILTIARPEVWGDRPIQRGAGMPDYLPAFHLTQGDAMSSNRFSSGCAAAVALVAAAFPALAESDGRLMLDRMRVLMVKEDLTEAEARARVADEAAQQHAPVASVIPRTGRPGDSFAGCETTIAAANAVSNPRDRAAAPVIDELTSREFASFSVDDLAAQISESEIDQCWFRLDGVWRADAPVALDTNVVPDGWRSSSPDLLQLANGVYKTPQHIMVAPTSHPHEALNIFPTFDGGEPVIYISTDGISLRQLLDDRSLRKTYRSARPAPGPGLAQLMTIEVTRTGYLRLRIGASSFYRPAPGAVTKIESNDPFMLGYTMENIVANMTGYDITKQNPNALLKNDKARVFDLATGRGAVIDERRAVPLGLKLVKDEQQGNVYFSRSMSSERDFQSMTKSNFGDSTRIGFSGSAGTGGKDGGASASANVDLSGGWGSSHAREQFSSLKMSGSVAEEVGLMRYKKLALVLDPAYARLSDAFIDEIAFAQRSGDFSEVIRKYGTHYAYAMTYGAAGQMTQKITSQAFERHRSESSSSNSSTNASFIVGNSESYQSSVRQSGSMVREVNEFGERTFSAVGGNGSWDQNGFSAGEGQYPILADLRPLSELLNPIYFPNEPEIYLDARRRFEDAIGEHLAKAATLSEDSLTAEIIAKAGKAASQLRKMKVTTAFGGAEMIEMKEGAAGVRKGLVRLCLINKRPEPRMIVHGVKGINAMQATRGGAPSCANFPASLTISLTGAASTPFPIPVSMDNARNIKLAPFDGRQIDFIWN
jgi:hypothetical protein